jgi:hypothetical protein
VVVSQPGGGPRKLSSFHDRRQRLETRRRAGDATGLADVVLVERASIGAQEFHDLAEPELEGLVEPGGGDVNQPGREL